MKDTDYIADCKQAIKLASHFRDLNRHKKTGKIGRDSHNQLLNMKLSLLSPLFYIVQKIIISQYLIK